MRRTRTRRRHRKRRRPRRPERRARLPSPFTLPRRNARDRGTQPVPRFTLPSDSGEEVSLDELRGKPVVLLLLSQGRSTPGCTAQACGIWDAWGEFEKRGRTKFRDKYQLPFTLLADEDHAVAETYGVCVEKRFAGKTYMGVERATFAIDAEGNLAKVLRRVKPDTHADDVLAALPH